MVVESCVYPIQNRGSPGRFDGMLLRDSVFWVGPCLLILAVGGVPGSRRAGHSSIGWAPGSNGQLFVCGDTSRSV